MHLGYQNEIFKFPVVTLLGSDFLSLQIFYFSDGQGYPGLKEFKERVQFIGDINKRDVSIQLSPTQFSDNGTFFCDVKNPPDVSGTQAETLLRVVLKGQFPPQTKVNKRQT